jgi:putative sterol carrier protein
VKFFLEKGRKGKISINCNNPSAGREKYFSYVMGESTLKPDLAFSNSADFVHQFWQGKVNVVSALLYGEVKRDGNISQAVKLLPAIKPIFDLYPQILKEIGRSDLIIS